MEYEWLFEAIKHIPTQHGVNSLQAIELYEQAKRSKLPIVEIGAYKGRSSSILALGSRDGNKVKVYSVDPFTLHGEKEENYKQFLKNMEQAGIKDLIEPIPKTSDKANVPDKIGLLFIDGSHEYNWVKYDFLKFEPKVVLDGWICMHDFHFPGVKRVFDELIYPAIWKGTKNKENKLTNFKLVKNMMVFKKEATPGR